LAGRHVARNNELPFSLPGSARRLVKVKGQFAEGSLFAVSREQHRAELFAEGPSDEFN
jgi:hypothetical protein